MLSLYEVELKQTRFYQEISAEERKEGELIGEKKGLQKGKLEGKQEECIKLLSRQLRRLSVCNRLLRVSYKISPTTP